MTSSRPGKRFDWKNLGKRAASAAVLAPIAILSVWFGGPPYRHPLELLFLAVLVAAAVMLGLEWGDMTARRTPRRVGVVVITGLLAALAAAYLGHYTWAWGAVVVASLICWLVARGSAEHPFSAAYGLIYLGPSLIALWWLRQSPEGRGWTTLLLATTWAADIGAFLVGNWLKGPKLAPLLSPNKTWSGFVGGLVFAMAAAELVSLISTVRTPQHTSFMIYVGVGLLAGLATMLGDLWESMLKRRFGVKDSGATIPGHGGLLDRVDGLVFAIIVVAVVRLLLLQGH